MQESEILSYFIQISLALLYIHDMGIAHGNLKLSNIIYRDVGGKHMLRISDLQICNLNIFKMKQKYGKKYGDIASFNYYPPELI